MLIGRCHRLIGMAPWVFLGHKFGTEDYVMEEMDDRFAPMYGTVFTVFDFIRLLIGDFQNRPRLRFFPLGFR